MWLSTRNFAKAVEKNLSHLKNYLKIQQLKLYLTSSRAHFSVIDNLVLKFLGLMQMDFSSNEKNFISNISKQCGVLIYRYTVKVETLQLAQRPLYGNSSCKWTEVYIKTNVWATIWSCAAKSPCLISTPLLKAQTPCCTLWAPRT